MSLIDSASLIVTPNAYKEGKLYSVIPSDGSGDMSVVRATTATRVNSAGLVELVPYNLFTYSEQFDDSSWVKFNTTVTANNTTAPNGTLTADKLIEGALTSTFGFYKLVASAAGANADVTITCYAKYNGRNVRLTNSYLSDASNFDLQNGTVISNIGSGVGSIESVGNGWYRCTLKTTTDGSGNAGLTLYLLDSSNNISYAGNGSSGAYLWGAQLNEGTTAKDYQKTETRLNIPRLDYSNGTCPSLLVEPQRTNFARNNNNLSGWVETIPADTITLNAGISPDGNNNAIKIIPSTTNAAHMIYDDSTNVSSGGNFTMSCYAKASGYSKIGLRESATVGYYATFNLANGTVIDNGGNNASIVDMGNGWYRCIVSVAFSGNVNMGIIALNDAYTSGQPYFPYEFAGDGTSGVLIYGPQFETSASYATSLISTAGAASVTRNADVISKTGISSLIGQTEGTVFLEYPNFKTDGNEGLVGIDDGSGNNRILFYSDSNNRITAQVRTNGVTQQPSSYSVSGNVKVAIAYNSSGFVFYVNGTLRFTGTAVVFSNAMSVFTFNHLGITASITNAAALWKTRLTNDELASLTTL